MASWSEISAAQPVACNQLNRAYAHDRLHHATLCAGPAPADLTAWVAALTAAVLCRGPERVTGELRDGCGTCATCRKLAGGNHPDVHHVRPGDKNTIPVDTIRALSKKIGLSCHEAPYKIVCIHGADAMAPAAQNALLKTLEEPTGDTLFFLLTSRPKAMLSTIRSRCTLVRLAPPPLPQQEAALQAAQIDPALWPLVAPLCGGREDVAQAYVEQDIQAAWQTLQALAGDGRGPTDVFKVAAEYGGTQPGCDMLLALVELHVHTVLAAAHGATPSTSALTAAGSAAAAARTAPLLQKARAQKNLHINRVLLLESVLFALTGDGAAAGAVAHRPLAFASTGA